MLFRSQKTDLFEKTLMLGKIEGRRRRGQQRMRWLGFPEWLLQLTFPPTLRDPFPAHRAHSHSLIITETWKLGVWLKIFSLVHR